MPKLSYELKDFSAGTITNADLADLPDGAASESKNVSPSSKMGAAEVIRGNSEIMANVPVISSMVVREEFDATASHLAVNIDNLFILIENYKNDTMLSDFVKIASEGQLLASDDHTTWHTSGDYYWTVVDTEPGYGYEIRGGVEVSGTLSTDGAVYIKPASLDTNGAPLADGNSTHVTADTTIPDDAYTFKNSKSFQKVMYASSDKTVVILYKGAGSTTTFKSPFTFQFAKGGYLWGNLGTNLDFEETDRGLFIGSSTEVPYLQHKQRDKDGDVFNYLVESECKPAIAQNAITNIDQMIWVKNSASTATAGYDKYDLITMIYGQRTLWQLIENTTAAPAIDYYEFSKSANLEENTVGLGGLASSVQDDAFYTWDFEGYNIYKCTKDTDSHTGQDWAISGVGTFCIKVDDIPEGGWIAGIAESKCDLSTSGTTGIPRKLYVLFNKSGGMTEGDVLIGVIEIAEADGTYKSGICPVTPLYKIPEYTHVTAYKNHVFEEGWFSVNVDVNPTDAVDMYWAKESEAALVPYRNGDYADVTFYTKYGFTEDACWVNTDKDKAALNVSEASIAVSDHLGANHDCVFFNVSPMGKTAYLKDTGSWREAKQWPNLWFDTSSDGEWTDHCTDQIVVQNTPYIVGVVPQDIGKTDKTIKEFAMKAVSAEHSNSVAIWNALATYMTTLETGGFTTHQLSAAAMSQSGPTAGGTAIGAAARNMFLHLQSFIGTDSRWISLKQGVLAHETTALVAKINAVQSYIEQKFVTRTISVDDGDGGYEDDTSDPFDPLAANFSYANAFGQYRNCLKWEDDPDGDYGDPDICTQYSEYFDYGLAEIKQYKIHWENFVNRLITVNEHLDAKTISVFDTAQIIHIPATDFPNQKPINQLQFYDRSGVKRLLSTQLDQGVMKHSDATITTSGATVVKKLQATTFTWKNYHSVSPTNAGTYTGDGSNGIFSAPVLDASNETQEATEGWALYKPDGNGYVIPNLDDTNDDGKNGEGVLSSTFSGDLVVKLYRYTNNADIQTIFNSGDIAIGMKVEEPSTCTSETDLANVKFPEGKTFMYNMSFLYDGYQESPLMNTPITVGPLTDGSAAGASGAPGIGYDTLDVTLKVRNSNPRLTHVQVYRKKDTAEKYRLVRSIAIDTNWTTTNPNATLGSGSASMEMMNSLDIEFIDDGDTGISYEALTGMPETLTDTSVEYSESESMGNYLYIANCRHPKLPDANRMIFRSQPQKFSIFNWAQDYLGMPEIIHSLQAYNNRLFAFSNKTMFRIDAYNMVMEAEYAGMGVAGGKAVTTMDGVLYIANQNGVFQYGGGKIRKISGTIDDRWDKLFKDFPNTKIDLAIDKKYNSIVCLFDNAGTNSVDLTPTEVYAFTPGKNKWDIWDMPARMKCSTINENNELMVCASASNVVGFNTAGEAVDSEDAVVENPYSLYTLHTGTQYVPFSWTTKELTLGEDARRKKFKTVKVIGKHVKLDSLTIDGVTLGMQNVTPERETGDVENRYQSWKIENASSSTGDITFNRIGKNIKIKVVDDIPNATATTTNDAVLKNVSITYSKKTLK